LNVKRWKEGEIIGKGSCGNVRIGLNLETGSIMAVKQVELLSKTSRVQQDVMFFENAKK